MEEVKRFEKLRRLYIFAPVQGIITNSALCLAIDRKLNLEQLEI